jgi:hypothetical protein
VMEFCAKPCRRWNGKTGPSVDPGALRSRAGFASPIPMVAGVWKRGRMDRIRQATGRLHEPGDGVPSAAAEAEISGVPAAQAARIGGPVHSAIRLTDAVIPGCPLASPGHARAIALIIGTIGELLISDSAAGRGMSRNAVLGRFSWDGCGGLESPPCRLFLPPLACAASRRGGQASHEASVNVKGPSQKREPSAVTMPMYH